MFLGVRVKLQLDNAFSGKWSWLHKLAISRLVGTFEPYQPVAINGNILAVGERACIDRWTAIEKIARECRANTLLDLGCAEGYFVQQAASEVGCIALGVDADLRRLTIAQNTATFNQVLGAGYLYSRITPALLERLPQFDVVLFLSVLHHMMYEHGIEYARTMMKSIHSKTVKRLIFDMGQSDETNHEWSRLLPKMEPDPTSWIADFLRQCGFSNVEVIGQTDAYKGAVRRSLFSVTP